jgi:hypothetical protein
LFLKPMWCVIEPAFRGSHEGLVRFMGIDELFAGLTISAEPHR